jgi:PAS domain S-box-containing protein
MKKGNGLQLNSSRLRSNSEELLPTETSSLLAESQRLVHELQVNKFELEMQNDELRRAWNEKQEAEALLGKYSDHYDFAPVGYFNLDSAGHILAVNFTGAEILGATRSLLSQKKLDAFISKETRAVLHDFLRRVFASGAKETCEVVFLRGKGQSIFVQVEAVVSESRQECRAVVIDITERKRAEDAHARLAEIVKSSADAIISKDLSGVILDWNAGAERLFGYHAEEVVGKPLTLMIPPELHVEEHSILQRMLEGEKVENFETVRISKDGRRIDVSVTVSPMKNAGCIVGVSKIVRDISERKRTEAYREMGREVLQILNETADLQESLEQVLASLKTRTGLDAVGIRLQERDDFPYFTQNGFPKGFIVTENTLIERDEKGRVCRDENGKVNLECACGLVISGKTDRANQLFTPGGSFWTNDSSQLLNLPLSEDPRIHPRNKCIREKYASLALVPIRNNNRVLGLIQFNDLSKGRFTLETVELLEGIATHIGAALMRKKAEVEKVKLENQLQHAQKMESVGRLAGGVAHDFNNMLGVIIGHANLALMDLDPAHPVNVNMEEIRKAAARSADLTRQLLAFARKQAIEPKVVDLNESVSGILIMLERLIGEQIDLSWKPKTDLWPVKVDPSQIDQILANLCVNARDAITDTGKITIETRNLVIDEDYCAHNADFAPGEYVCLAVSDNGHGMDKETLAHIFEPFFTTKGIGEGTGLGLSTVYGAARQNNGFINAYSEPGLGTTLTLYLPRYEGQVQARTNTAAIPPSGGKETILLVEDEPAILDVASEILKRLGYTVLSANSPDEAMHLARVHAGDISLLLTDVVMPEMNGRDLAEKLLSLYPHVKRLFMSGYTSDVIAHHGVLDAGVHFIQKPFSVTDLAAKVREVLDEVNTDDDKQVAAAVELRSNAEEHLQVNPTGNHAPRSLEEMNRSFHELEVTHIELEMQNDELMASRAETEVSLDKYSALFDSGPVGYLTLDRMGVINAVSLSSAGLFGVDRPQLLAKRFGLYIAPESRLTFADFLDKVFRSQTKVTCEVTLLQEGDIPTFVQLAALAATSGQECHAAMIDITERKRTEDLLRINTAEVQDLYNNAPCCYHSLDAKGQFVRINETGLRWLGYQRDEIIGVLSFTDVISQESAETFRINFPKLLEQGWVRNLAFEMVRKDGSRFPAIVNSEAIRDGEGNYLMSRSMIFDATENKRTEEKLKKYARRLIVMEEELRKKIAMDLHDDIAQVLSALGLQLAHISNNLKGEPENNLRQVLEDSRKLTKDVSRSVRDLMVELRPTQLDEYGLVTAIRSHVEHYANRIGVVVAVNVDPEVPRLTAKKETAIFRITQEALQNVAKHAAATKVTISLTRVGEIVRLTIADDGKGFAAQDTSPLPTVSGWGLTIMRERAELVGGSFRVDSDLGRGTTIMVEIKR